MLVGRGGIEFREDKQGQKESYQECQDDAQILLFN